MARILCIATIGSLFTGQGAFARDSQFTRQGSGPMYWISYEHQYTKNTYMPEQRFKNNIDWMAENFLPYGYDMVSTDGWIEGATMLNENGYAVSHNDHWITNPLDMSGNGGSTSGGKLVNGDFEDGETGWTFSGNSDHGVDSNDGHTGSKYWMWSNDPYTDSLKQTVTGLANGKYILTVWSKISRDDNFTTDGSKAEIRLGDPASSSYVVQAMEPAKDEYGTARYGSSEVEINVTDGQLPMEFYIDAKASSTSLQLDDITLEAVGGDANTATMPIGNQVVNGDFDDGETGWTFDGPAQHGINTSDQGATKSLWTWALDSHEETISQKINNLPAGKYKVSAKAKTKNNMSNNGSTAFMRIKGYDASNPDAVDETPITLETWQTYTKEINVTTTSSAVDINTPDDLDVTTPSAVDVTTPAAVNVSTNGSIDLEFYYNSNGNINDGIDLDDITIEAVPEDGEEPAWQYPTEQYPDGHTWKFWADYAASKGLKYGVYYNPLWVSPEVVKNPDKYTVPGHPDIQVASLVKSDPNNAAGGDRFNGGQGTDRSLYWLNIDAPGAEEYIKGYINFFKDQGVKFLRVDFLSWYETADDPNLGHIGQQHTRDQYEKALKWMSEAAGPDMILSLVMPNLKDHGELERKYGDMIRINEDVFGGGWDHTSGRRQNWLGEVWSQWASSFQGLTGFSDIDGRGSLINDADFTRFNTFSGEYANNEKKSEVSLYTIAGAPITIADQYDTIGDNAKFYRNTELIELNKLGLSAKPIFNTNAHYKDNKSRDSERWVGQLPDGSYVVGLFNRTDEPKAYTFDFNKELSLDNGGFVRDLWGHQDLGLKKTYTVVLDPHDCSIIKVIPASQTLKYQAEIASYEGAKFNDSGDHVSGPQFNNDHDGYGGSGFIANINQTGDKITFAIDAPQEGNYELNLKYANGGYIPGIVSLYSRDKVSGDTIDTQDVTLPVVTKDGSSTWDAWGAQKQSLKLQKGVNLVTVEGKLGNINLDSIELAGSVGAAKLLNSDFQNGFNNWSRNNMVNQSLQKDSDNQFVKVSGDQAYNSDLWQYVVPGAGTYTLKAKVRDSGKFDEASLYTNYSGGTKKTNIPVSSDWTTIEVPNIQIGSDEVIKLGTLINGQAGSSVDIDDVELVQCNPQDYTGNVNYLGKLNLDETTPYTVDGNAVILNTNGTPKVKIDFMKNDVARVWMEPSGIFQKDASFVVNNEQAATKPQISDAGEYIKLQTPELTIRVYKQPFKIAYYDATNTNLITEESDNSGLGYNGDTGVSENIKMDQDEHFYGLGMDKDQDATVLDQRGRKVVMKNGMVSVNNEGNVSDISGTYLASTKGYGIYFDNTYIDTAFDMGATDPNNYSFSAPNGEMVYYFMKGDNLNDTMKDYASLSGKAPIPPKWALGYIQSKFGYRSWDEVNTVVDTFRSKGIPVDGMVLDAYWAANNHYFDMTWADSFKNPKAAMDGLAAKVIKMTNIVDPYIQLTSNFYEEGKKKGYFVKDSSGNTIVYDAWYGKSGLIDYTNPEAAKWYTDHVKDLHDSGVKGWWIDLNEPEIPTDPVTDQFQAGSAGEVKNAYALEEAKAFYNGQRSYTDERVWSLARSGFSGIQQYGTTVWSGDNASTWQAFTHNLQKGISAGMSGIPYFTNDTGGFIQGPPSAELYTRWMQASAFMPIFRAHGDDSANKGKGTREPWQFGTEAEANVTKAIKQRYELLPYIYAAARQTSIDNTPIMRALAADYTSDSKVTNITDQWMFGSSMMVAPVHEQGAVSREVYLPKGTWYDWNDDTKEYTGGNSIDYAAALDKTPVFVKEGSIIPMGQDVNYVGEKPDDYINLKVYRKAAGEETKFSLYEDDGNTYSYEKNQSATTDITTKDINGTINLNIAAINGEYLGKVTDRVWAAQVKVDSLDKSVTNIKRNNVDLKQVDSMDALNAGSDVWYYDSSSKTVYLRTSKVSTSVAQNISIDTSNESNPSNGLAELQALYDAHKNDTQGNYTVASWTNFVTALNNAKSVIDSVDATQTQIDNAKYNLQSAIGSLKVQSSNSDHGSSGSSSSSNSSSSNNSSSAETTNSNKTEDSNAGGNTTQNGWNKVNDSWQFVKADGSLATGWYNDNGTWYNLSNEGKMNTGWIKDTDGKWYYLKNSGEMAKDWVKDTDGNWYYLKNSGEMATGWVKNTDGKWYYLKSSGAMASNEYIDGYYLGTSGAWIQ